MQDLEQAIRERAYHLWLADGRHDGKADAHWLAAQHEVLAMSLGTFGRVKAGAGAQVATNAERKLSRKSAKGKRRAA